MNGKINKRGLLEIERAGTMKQQACPYVPVPCECGDWCPLFSEPDTYSTGQAGDELTEIDICSSILSFDQFSDEREGE